MRVWRIWRIQIAAIRECVERCYFLLAHRVLAAFRAIAFRRFGDRFAALAFPPLLPPSFPRATAAGFFPLIFAGALPFSASGAVGTASRIMSVGIGCPVVCATIRAAAWLMSSRRGFRISKYACASTHPPAKSWAGRFQNVPLPSSQLQKRVSFRAEWSERSERNAVEESRKLRLGLLAGFLDSATPSTLRQSAGLRSARNDTRFFQTITLFLRSSISDWKADETNQRGTHSPHKAGCSCQRSISAYNSSRLNRCDALK
jgi:hypothetical protein